ncbi:hypothetical protein DM01DRAFT_348469 [Hesseltinella vesiculosa]|uniref:Uncharacterized protein n=1 Tax=Hesseltinella vesiculosa TaxID=101127 RepID=A0A1X2GF95_9FUNG|nr:hypothetical protein DM01DRAFT_348469 [Hesseltinella vesiculosa]
MATITQQRREQDQQWKRQKRLAKRKKKDKPSLSMYKFTRSRSLAPCQDPRSLLLQATRSWTTSLQCQTPVRLEGPPGSHALKTNRLAFDHGTGQCTMASLDGRLVRYSYQCDPFFTAWPCSAASWSVDAQVTSMQYGPIYTLSSQQQVQPILGCTMGSGPTNPNRLWRYLLPLPEPLTEDQADQLWQHRSDSTAVQLEPQRVAPIVDPVLLPEPLWDSSFAVGRDTFWCSHWSPAHNVILVGSTRHLTVLSSGFDMLARISSSSEVFATSQSSSQPSLAWVGCRNGKLSAADRRVRASFVLHFRHRTAITHLRPMDDWHSGHDLLAASMDGQLSLWDRRFPKTPTRSLQDHQNEHTRDLGFDVDVTDTFTVAMAGNDHRVRIWSLLDHQPTVMPSWTSPALSGAVPSVSLLANPPPIQPAWSHLIPDIQNARAGRRPGLLICSQHPHAESPSLNWYTIRS